MTEGPKEFYQTEKHPLGISRLKEEKEEEKRKEKKAEVRGQCLAVFVFCSWEAAWAFLWTQNHWSAYLPTPF